MAETLIGIILLAIPFICVFCFTDRKKGFAYVLFSAILFSSFFSILALLLGRFNYFTVVSGQILFSVSAIIFFIKKREKIGERIGAMSVDWLAFSVVIILFFNLAQVHFNYSGKINISTDMTAVYHDVKNFNYPYPYYSDEWYSVAFINNYIGQEKISFVNPFDGKSSFINPEFFFHSYLAGIFLLLKLNPVTSYVVVAIFVNILIAILAYLFLKLSGVRKLIAAIAPLFLIYITAASNLPGIWNLIPMNMGLVVFLIGLCFLAAGKPRPALINSILVFLFYPPFFIFYALILFLFFYTRTLDGDKNNKTRIIFYFFCAMAILALSAIVFSAASPQYFKYFLSKIFYQSFTPGLIPQYPIYKIIPIPALLAGLFGLIVVCKKMPWLVIQVVIGLVFWLVYCRIDFRVFIDYQRIIFLTSVLLVIASGFGLNWISTRLRKIFGGARLPVVAFAEIFIIIIFIALTPNYTKRDNWRSFILVGIKSSATYYMKAPANAYLAKEDLDIFRNISGKRFLSMPWKGTVIGVATGNIPDSTKEGTISINPDKYWRFVGADCSAKEQMAKDLDYVYSNYEINCPGFKGLAKSGEGFILYEVEK